MKNLTHILLIFSMLVSFSGISTGTAVCKAICDIKEAKCCKPVNSSEIPCCDLMSHSGIKADLPSLSSSCEAPEFIALPADPASSLSNLFTEKGIPLSKNLYQSPLITRDIGLLIRVFRI